jgi:hypothetical protein
MLLSSAKLSKESISRARAAAIGSTSNRNQICQPLTKVCVTVASYLIVSDAMADVLARASAPGNLLDE